MMRVADKLQAGQFKSAADIPADSFLRFMPRFQPDVFDENLKLVKEVEQLASKKGCTPGQVALGWVLAHSGKKGFPDIIPIPGTTTSDRVKENVQPAALTDEDMGALEEILKKFPPIGNRYHEEGMKHTEL